MPVFRITERGARIEESSFKSRASIIVGFAIRFSPSILDRERERNETLLTTLQLVPRNFLRSYSYKARGKWLQCFLTFGVYIYIKSRTKILPRKFISYHSFLPFLPLSSTFNTLSFPPYSSHALFHPSLRVFLLRGETRCFEKIFRRYLEKSGGRGGGENNTICGIPYVWRADEPRPSTCLIFIGRSSSSQRPSFLRIYSSLSLLSYVVHLGFPLLRLQEFFVYAIIINLEPTSGRGKADGKRRRKRRRERARERGNCGRG